jgi:uncharacterized membrane protein
VRSETGLRRLVNFSDAVVAIAITLLILPLVDAAGSIGTTGIDTFLRDHASGLTAFLLSFAVIGSFWWGQHRMFERVKNYNAVLVAGMFFWLLSIVFLPFPTELIQSTQHGIATVHAIYIGTMVVTALAALVQQWAVIRWPELQDKSDQGSPTIDGALILALLMAAALLVTVAAPSAGVWPLLLLLLSRPLEQLAAKRRSRLSPT